MIRIAMMVGYGLVLIEMNVQDYKYLLEEGKKIHEVRCKAEHETAEKN